MVSIVVPIYNVEKYLNKCVDSLINQTYRDLEIILVEDGSPDNCALICDEYTKIDPRIKVIHKANGGSSSARNAGVNAATGEYIMFVDSDDWIDENTIKECIKANSNYDADCILFDFVKENSNSSVPVHLFDKNYYFDEIESKTKVYRRIFGPINKELHNPEKLDYLSTCWMKIYKTKFAKKGKYFDTKEVGSCEDGLFNIYALYDCNSFLYINKSYYHYRRNTESLTSSYKSNLTEMWDKLFFYFQEFISNQELDNVFLESLNNRISLSLIGFGFNCLRKKNGSKIKEIRNYIKREDYRNSIKLLKIRNLSFVWKIFFIFAKMRMAIPVYLMLKYADSKRK